MRKRHCGVLAALLVAVLAFAGQAADIYVSPTGTDTGAGTQNDPLDLNTALSDAQKVSAGDTVWLMEGTYTGPFTKPATPAGTAQSPIIYRAMPGARARITADETGNGYRIFSTYADYVWYWGLEISATGPAPAQRGYGIDITDGDGVKLINLIVHDNPNRSGICAYATGDDHEIYGCLVYRNGKDGNAYAHGMYTQNTSAFTLKTVEDCLIFNNFGYGVHGYTAEKKQANFLFKGCAVYGSGQPEGMEEGRWCCNYIIGSSVAGNYADNITLDKCHFYQPPGGRGKYNVDMGYMANPNHTATLTDNVFIGCTAGTLILRKWNELTFRGNKLYNPDAGRLYSYWPTGYDLDDMDYDENTHYTGAQSCNYVSLNGNGISLSTWQNTYEQDQNSTFIDNAPTGVWTYLRENKYEEEMANLVVYNWDGGATVSVDLGTLWDLETGDGYRIYDVENVFGEPVAQGTYQGAAIDLRMTGSYAPGFACFRVHKTDPPDKYAGPNGTANGAGTPQDPMDLNTALNNANKVEAGDTVWLLAGTYTGPFTKNATPAGTAQLPIYYRAVPGARVTIQPAQSTDTDIFTSNADHVRFQGIEITANGTLGAYGVAFKIADGDDVKLINLVTHDNGRRSGIEAPAVGSDHEIYGCISYNNGLNGSGSRYGIHAFNTDSDSAKSVKDCVIFGNGGVGLHCASTSQELVGMEVEGVTSFCNVADAITKEMLIGSSQSGIAADNVSLSRCMVYTEGNTLDIGYSGNPNGTLSISESVFVGSPVWVRNWEPITFQANSLYNATGAHLCSWWPSGYTLGNMAYDYNSYYVGYDNLLRLNGSSVAFGTWQSTYGQDANGSLIQDLPDDAWVFLRPNVYEPDVAYLTVYNWPAGCDMSLDLAATWDRLEEGDDVTITNVENIWGTPEVDVTWDGDPVTLDITGDYSPDFACYRIVRNPI